MNGFHASRKLIIEWNNTKLDSPNGTTVHMYNLNVSHSGKYECIIQYEGIAKHDEKWINLILTGMSVKFNI